MVTFTISTGRLTDGNGNDIGPAYSGAPGDVDNPDDVAIKAHGPIPPGLWNIGAVVADGGKLGPNVLPLTPVDGTATYGRGGFWVHGDNSAHDESASEGCIVAAPTIRQAIDADPDRLLDVVA